LTEATKLTKGSIYGNFENKEEVALAAFDHNLGIIQQILRSEINKRDSYREKLLVFATVYEDFLKHPFPEGGCPILNTAIEADDTHPLLKKKASDAIMSWKNSIMQLIKKGIEEGEFDTNEDPEQIALSMIALIEGAIMITKATGKLNYRKMILATVEKMINEL
ncbi:MAG: TetR/AcrR family transcriptional regulator, partial [Bacteroidetes bacterium]|nr:TetR/AcrR family transcriptional regulator [Bacteroidota bacterium]